MKGKKQKKRDNNNSKPARQAAITDRQDVAPAQETVEEEIKEHRYRRSAISPVGIALLAFTVVVVGILTWYWWGALKSSEYDAKDAFSIIMPNDTLTINRGDHVTVKGEQLIAQDGRMATFSSDIMECLTDKSVDDGPSEYAIPNENGAKQFYQYSKKDDPERAGFVFVEDTTKKVKLAFGEMLEVGRQSKSGHEVFVLGNRQIKPVFKLGKKTSFVTEEGHKSVRLANLQVYDNLLMLNVENTGDSNKVVIYPEAGNDSILTISKNEFGKDVSAQLKDASNLTFRVACNNHISTIVKADEVKLFYNSKAEASGINMWAIIFSVLTVLQLAGLWFLFERKRSKTKHYEDDDVDLSVSSEEPSAEEKELKEINQKIESLNNKILSIRQRLNALPVEDLNVDNQEEEIKDTKTTEEGKEVEKDKFLIYGADSMSDEDKVKWIKDHILSNQKYDANDKVIEFKDKLAQCPEESRDSFILGYFGILSSVYKEACKDNANKESAESKATKPETEHHDEPLASTHQDARHDLEGQLKVAQGNLDTLYAKKKTLEDAIRQKSVSSDALAQSLRQQLGELKRQNKDLLSYKQNAEAKISQTNEAAERRVKKTEENAERRIQKVEDDARKDIQEARRNEQQAREETKQIRDQVTNEFKAEIIELNSTIGQQTTKISQLGSSLLSTEKTLVSTQQALENAKATIQVKEDALARFHQTIKEVDPAREYAEQLEKLLELGGKIETSALKLSYKKDIDDYLIPKYIARFRNAISVLDMNVFTTDVFNAAKAQFVYKTQMLATFDIGNRESFHQSMKMYFFDNYMKKYVDALVVLNETMIGTQYTVDGVVGSDVEDFMGYRAALATVLKALEVDVEYVKIMDKSDDNLGLIVIPKDLPDIDCPKNSICQMENCIVYLHGSDKPNEKIEVIVKN